MRRAGSAKPEATSAARTRSRASETALSGKPNDVECGQPRGDLNLDIDGASFDTLERDGGDALDHVAPTRHHSSATLPGEGIIYLANHADM